MGRRRPYDRLVLVTHDPDAIAFVDRTVNLRDGALTEGSGTNATVS
ncbi:MAG: hypothetical protein WA484_16610 [Solirubrobacteraceae bacterium]